MKEIRESTAVTEASISLTVSKADGREDLSFLQAVQADAGSRMETADTLYSLSNEAIVKGDELLGSYTVLSDALHGGMGSVWKVHHSSWNTDLAMKRPQPRFFEQAGSERKAQFIAECESWIGLGLHPDIVSCYYVREIGGVPSVFSEWMEEGSLKDRIRDGSLYEGSETDVQLRILDIALQAASGLVYSYAKGLIHQDVKPGNILLKKDWDAGIADFGLARAESHLRSHSRSAYGYTPQYCPAEQAAGEPAQKWMD
ncbi:MAG: protein kinase, partial [Solobacterium sp.]|nr:protein kinase [Solobacterium sp.]